jgi:integrase
MFGKRRIGEVGRDELRSYLRDVQAKTSLDTRRKVQQVLHKVFQVAVNEGWLTRNPLQGIGMPGAKVGREAHPLTETEVEGIANQVPARYRALVWALAETGARIGELTALRVKNLNEHIRIVENAPEVNGHKVTGTPKTESSERLVPISPKLREVLREHLDGVDDKGRPWVNRFDPESYVFTGERGQQIRQNNFRKRILQPAAERAKVNDVTTHDFRHTAISLWLTRGLTPFEVAGMVGHTDLEMIKRRYGHLYVDELQEKIERLSGVD